MAGAVARFGMRTRAMVEHCPFRLGAMLTVQADLTVFGISEQALSLERVPSSFWRAALPQQLQLPLTLTLTRLSAYEPEPSPAQPRPDLYTYE